MTVDGRATATKDYQSADKLDSVSERLAEAVAVRKPANTWPSAFSLGYRTLSNML